MSFEMTKYVSLELKDFYTVQGRIGRIDFIIGILIITLILIALYKLSLAAVFELKNFELILLFKGVFQVLGVALITPLLIKRFHDLNTAWYWVLMFWLVLPFSLELSALLNKILGFMFFNPFSAPVILLELAGAFALLVLVFKQGNPEVNEWGAP